MPFRSTKTFPPISCAFRQWRAESHCRFLHGYALEFTVVFEAEELDDRNWVVDFGALKSLRLGIEETFDHRTLVAEDDPALPELYTLKSMGALDLLQVSAVGCEAFATFVCGMAHAWLIIQGMTDRVRIFSVECREHHANSAIYLGPSQK